MSGAAPSIFIGSSSESRYIADAFQDVLGNDFDVVVWNHDVFALGDGVLDSLINACVQYDFAIFIAAGDDLTTRRGRERSSPRDNVILEIGLFMGALGKDRVFVATPIDTEMHLPTDLDGICLGKFKIHDKDHLRGAVGPVARKISDQARKLGGRERNIDKAIFAAAVCYKIDEHGLQIRLVKTSRNRWIFPKTKIMPGEASSVAAIRCGEDEGGVSGRPDIFETAQFRHLKEDTGVEQDVVVHLVRAVREFPVEEAFRQPAWYSIDEAEVELKKKRSGRYMEEIRSILRWAQKSIEMNGKTIRHLSGVVALKKGEGSTKILLITSRTNKNWVIPKGGRAGGESYSKAAIREAMEEAGLTGNIVGDALGEYEYTRLSIRHVVRVFKMKVTEESSTWDEVGMRERRWFDVEEALKIVKDGSLNMLIRKAVE